jgi:glycolate oxidase FAD binding subunit
MTTAQRNETVVSSTLGIRETIAAALASGQALRVVGRGSWLDANRPVQAESKLEVGGLDEIVEYEPGDLTLTARAGTSLDAIARVTAAHGQWLALDPPADPTRASIGATVATASYGPLAHSFGTPRDMTLGVEFVTGSGNVVRAGGRVVKNVAGFDLTRLVTGSWGTLGVITEVTVRLRALPAVEATIGIEVGQRAERPEQLRRALRTLPFTPLAAQWIDAGLAHRLGVELGSAVLVRIGGNEEAVGAQRSALESLGTAMTIDGSVWTRLQAVEPAVATVFRLSRAPSAFAGTWHDATSIVESWPGSYCHGDAGRGVVRCVLPAPIPEHVDRVRSVVNMPFAGTRVFERLPAVLWSDVPSSLRTSLERGVKAAFDPRGILNPGIFGELQ